MLTIRPRTAVLACVLSAAVVSVACIESKTEATIVIVPDGSARWTVLQRHVHAVANTPDQRLVEEQDFLAAVVAGRHDQVRAFRALGASGISTQVVSADWPFAVQTEARFANLADVFNRAFAALGLEGEAVLTRDGEGNELCLVKLPER